jgi:CubicO group peptidase (beta-lactamase class C family)
MGRRMNLEQIYELSQCREMELRLKESLASRPETHAIVGLLCKDRWTTVARVPHSSRASPSLTECAFPVGCIAKLLTAELVLRAEEQARWTLNTGIAQFFPGSVFPYGTLFEGVTVRDLLEHSHGLDGSNLERCPRTRGGFIHNGALIEELAANGRLSEPGRLYSYSEVGAWIAGAILEQTYRKTYAQVLQDELFDSCDIVMRTISPEDRYGGDGAVCPALGGVLALAAKDVLHFLKLQCTSRRADRMRIDNVRALPGWSSPEGGVCLGWKYYGDGWFGHNSAWRRASSMVRVHPTEQVALVVVSSDNSPQFIATRLLRRIIPELTGLKTPQARGKTARNGCESAQYAHRYGCASTALEVRLAAHGRLYLHAFRCQRGGAQEPYFCGELKHLDGDIFAVDPPDPAAFSFVEFVDRSDSGFRFIWNGRCIFPRRAA